MNWEVIGIVSQVASAFAIIVTLAYFAVQTRQANVTAATSTTIKGTEMASHWREMLVTDAGLADALVRANAKDTVSPSEELRLNLFFDDLFIVGGAIDASGIRSGALHADQASVDYVLAVFRENPAMVPRWHQQKTWMEKFSPDFTKVMNDKLAAEAQIGS